MSTNATESASGTDKIVGLWSHPALIQPNNFVHKSLSNWSFNIAIGCGHGCRFCYVPSASTNKLGPQLAELGVDDPDAQWGDYVFLRRWDREKFLTSLRSAQNTPRAELAPDGNRAIIFCSTTDPYQAFRDKALTRAAERIVREALTLIRDHSDLNVRILTRSPLAEAHFDLYKTFGHRLLFGMSVPTLDDRLSRIYEPRAPGPARRLHTLRKAADAGIPVFAAMAPTYPECDAADMERTMRALAELDPVTIFHEPINIRAENVERIAEAGRRAGVRMNTRVFDSRDTWREYAVGSLLDAELIAERLGISRRLHLWPDKALGSQVALNSMPDARSHRIWLEDAWRKISAWPKPAKSSYGSIVVPRW